LGPFPVMSRVLVHVDTEQAHEQPINSPLA
jgi:hypothetical protein